MQVDQTHVKPRTHGCLQSSEHMLKQKGVVTYTTYYSLRILFPAILLIVFRIKTRNSQSKESRIQNPAYGNQQHSFTKRPLPTSYTPPTFANLAINVHVTRQSPEAIGQSQMAILATVWGTTAYLKTHSRCQLQPLLPFVHRSLRGRCNSNMTHEIA